MNLKHFVYTILILSCNAVIYAQVAGTSKFYNMTNGNEYITESAIEKDHFITISRAICDPQEQISPDCEYLMITDSTGKITHFKNFIDRNWWVPYSAIKIVNDTIYLFGMNNYEQPYNWNLYKTNLNGDSLDWQTFHFSENTMYAEAMEIVGEYVYLLGRYYIDPWHGNLHEVILLKADKQGNIIKEQRFKNLPNNLRITVCYDLAKSDDGNLFVTAHEYYSDIGKKPYLIKLNADLDVIWVQGLNPNTNDLNLPDLLALEDGGAIFGWCINTEDLLDELGWDYLIKYDHFPPTINRFDKNCNIVWSDTLWTLNYPDKFWGPEYDISRLISAHNGDIIGCGDYYDRLIKKKYGWLFRYNKNGELLWEKIYEDVNHETKYSFFLDVEETSSGNIVCSGNYWDKNGDWNNAEHGWVICVDKEGCFEPGCGITDSLQLVDIVSEMITGIYDQIDTDVKDNDNILIYPVPAFDKIHISTQGSIDPVFWSISDIMGRIAIEGKIDDGEIDVSMLNPGIYILIATDKKGMSAKGKFVKIDQP